MSKLGINKNVILWGFFIVVLFLLLVTIDKLFLPQLNLKGGNIITINYEDTYKEKGYEASYLGDDLTDEVSIKGSVDTKKLGEYEIIYEVHHGIYKRKVKRYVYVEDIEKPKLSITKEDLYVCPQDNVKAEKVRAIDNYDGDISSKVKVKILKDKIIYSVVDSSGNRKSITKKIIYKDIKAPNLTLEGTENIVISVGDEFVDPGYNSVDNCDKDISDKVKVEGRVDTNTIGDYEITYKVVDSSKNESVLKRKVKVVDNKGVIYLTFDDGPNDGTTNVILDILKEEGVVATFFVTSKGPDELIKREMDEGHTVALHTSSHNYQSVYASDEAFFNDLNTVSERVKRITGVESKLIRFPGGSSNTISRRYCPGIMTRLTQEVVRRGYKYYDWNISSGDAGETTDPNEVYSNVVNGLRYDRVNMVLMHDIKTYTRDALRNIIKYGKENGYRFEKITNDTEMVAQRVNN